MIGQQFGNYRATALLGEGGMGAVYLAEHPAIGRRVAVKVLHPNYTRDEQLLGRFLNEARAANAIRHPNIIEILDSGLLADGTPFLVMELLEGESLGTRLRRGGALPVATALGFASQTASALGAAHAKGIVHRDLKPDNLFIVPDPQDPARERMKVLDFGIAKLQQGSSPDSVKTRTGMLMGTPIYMSPEQCRGTKAVDHRSDMYSLGVILYEMLVGHPPFVSEGFGELVHLHLNVGPSSMRRERPEIPPALEAIVFKMLAKTPEERFGDMGAVQAALESSGGFQVRSSPDFGVARPISASPTLSSALRYTTFTTGAGERVAVEPSRAGIGLKVAIALGAMALAVGAYLLLGAGRQGLGGSSVAGAAQPVGGIASAPPSSVGSGHSPASVPGSPSALLAAPSTGAPRKPITLRVDSDPTGATVLDEGGSRLGVTPLLLTRPPGGELKLHLEKDGYAPGDRNVALDADQTVELTLEHKKAKRGPRKHRDAAEEPAKL